MLERAAPYDLSFSEQFGLESAYVRGEAYLKAAQGQQAAAKFCQILEHPGPRRAIGSLVIQAQYVLRLVLPNLFGVIGANMGCKLFVALQLEVAHQFVEGFVDGSIRRFKPPAAFGATKTQKIRLLNPYQLPTHSRLCRCANECPLAVIGTETLLSQRSTARVQQKTVAPFGSGRRCIKG